VAAETTLLHAKAWAAEAGIQAVRDITAMDRLGVPVFVSERRSSAAYPYAFGKGLVPVAAEIGAYMEAIEAYLAEPGVAPVETSYGLPRDLSGIPVGCDPILAYASKPGFHAAPDTTLPLARAVDVESGAPAWVPAELVFNPAPAGPSFYGASSNGLASGNSVLEASIHALYELIERDIWSLEFVRRQARCLGDAGLPGYVQRIIAAAGQNGVRLLINHVPNDYGLPFFAAFLFEPGRLERRCFNGGWGCHALPEVALMRAVTEAAQSRLAFQLGYCGIEPSGSAAVEAERIGQQIAIISGRLRLISFADIAHESPGMGLEAQWIHVINRLRRVIDRPIYRVVYTQPENPLQVVRLIVPMMEYFTPSTNRLGPRMRAACDALVAERS